MKMAPPSPLARALLVNAEPPVTLRLPVKTKSGAAAPVAKLSLITVLVSTVTLPARAVSIDTPPLPPALLPKVAACTEVPSRKVTWLSPRRTIRPPGPKPELLAAMVLASIVKAPERMKTLPPRFGPAGVLAVSKERAAIATGAKLVTVNAVVLVGSTDTSPVPATPAT